jgi:hypothetical protein
VRRGQDCQDVLTSTWAGKQHALGQLFAWHIQALCPPGGGIGRRVDQGFKSNFLVSKKRGNAHGQRLSMSNATATAARDIAGSSTSILTARVCENLSQLA